MRSCVLAAACLLAACTATIDSNNDDDGDDQPTTCEQARTYTGYAGTALEADRAKIVAGSDRLRLKPYGALSAEYRAALGLSTFDTSVFAATFGKPPPRWYTEPTASTNTLYAAFALAYDACTQYTATPTTYNTAPTTQSADTVCRDLARQAWHRDATDAEADACVGYAVNQTDPNDDPRRRWAYACAAVLSASGFLAY